MKILFVGHDISYVQFYKALSKELSHDKDIEPFHLYLRPSASIYAKLTPSINSSSFALSRFVAKKNEAFEKPSDLIDLKFYDSILTNSKSSKLIQLYNCYKNRFTFEMNLKFKVIDVAILPGEYRLFEQAIVNSLKSQSPETKILYFEAGPPGYIYLDPQGVNANTSITKTKFSNVLSEALNVSDSSFKNFYIYKPLPKIIKNSFLIIDLIWLLLARLRGGLWDLDEYNLAFFNRLKKIANKIFQKTHLELNKYQFKKDNNLTYIMYAGQVSSDVNSTHFGLKEESILIKLSELLDSSDAIRIIWRDHPLEKKNHLFSKIEGKYKGRIFKLDELSLDESLSLVNGVVTVNSNTGIEALSKGLPLYLLGKAYYQLVYGVTDKKNNFLEWCNQHQEQGPDIKIIHAIQEFVKNTFFPIDYRGENYENIYLIRDYLLSLKRKLSAK